MTRLWRMFSIMVTNGGTRADGFGFRSQCGLDRVTLQRFQGFACTKMIIWINFLLRFLWFYIFNRKCIQMNPEMQSPIGFGSVDQHTLSGLFDFILLNIDLFKLFSCCWHHRLRQGRTSNLHNFIFLNEKSIKKKPRATGFKT